MRFILFLLLPMLGLGCKTRIPPSPLPSQVTWAVFENSSLGFRLAYPDVFQRHADTDEVAFRYQGVYVVRVVHLTAQEAEDRGLWAKHAPIGKITLGGRQGYQYAYDHWDAFSYVHTLAFVVPHKGAYLGFEFRTDSLALDAVQKHLFDAFQFTN